MNKWLKAFALFVMALPLMGCSEDNELPGVFFLDVTPNNIAGSWELVSYQSGLHLAEGSYVYVDFVRKDKSYKLFQNTDSFGPRCITGSYNIVTDPELGAVLRGSYDYENGFWNHSYIVKSLTSTEMVWVAVDDATDVSVYRRCTIPDDVLASAPADEE